PAGVGDVHFPAYIPEPIHLQCEVMGYFRIIGRSVVRYFQPFGLVRMPAALVHGGSRLEVPDGVVRLGNGIWMLFQFAVRLYTVHLLPHNLAGQATVPLHEVAFTLRTSVFKKRWRQRRLVPIFTVVLGCFRSIPAKQARVQPCFFARGLRVNGIVGSRIRFQRLHIVLFHAAEANEMMVMAVVMPIVILVGGGHPIIGNGIDHDLLISYRKMRREFGYSWVSIALRLEVMCA